MSVSKSSEAQATTAAFFCPQAAAPDEAYLNGLYSFLSQDNHGKLLLAEIVSLKTDGTWETLASQRQDIRSLTPGEEFVDMMHDWAKGGPSGSLAAARSGIVALPLLLIVQIGQYLRYLQYHEISHREFLASVRGGGGLQGYCGGLPTAIAIACSTDESEVVRYTAIAIRIMIGVGVYGEIADETRGSGSTTLALRLKYEGQGEELTSRFPGTHVSAITDPRSVSIVGPAAKLHELFVYAREKQRLQVQKMDIRGQVHNPDNAKLAVEFCDACRGLGLLQLPDASKLQVPVRSNRSGELLTQGSLSEELVTTILASRCEWWNLLNEVAKDVKKAGIDKPALVYFGLTDCVATTPFVKLGLRPSKAAAYTLIPSINRPPSRDLPGFPEDSIAVVGASCRLPGANNMEELWQLLAAGQDRHQELSDDRFDLKNSFRASQSGNFMKDRRFFGNFVGNIQGFDNAIFGINPREAASMDPQQRLLLEVAYEALEDSGYLNTHQRRSGDNVGCFIGASLVEYLDNTNAYAPTAYTSTGTIRAFLCGRLSYFFGWSGPAEVIDTACSSSLVAINRACKAIQTGECRMALAGGVNLITGMNNYFDLGKAGFLSPTGQCKPFDASADGYCRSDGAGLIVLKKLKHAIASGDAILGVIPGTATNQGGLSASITVPHSDAQMALYKNVLGQAGIPPSSVTYVESHGTGTQAGDPLEMASIRSVFGRGQMSDPDTLFVGSIKGNLGHCETAAGVAGVLKIIAMLKHKQIPPQANHFKLNPKIPPLEPDGLAISKALSSWDVPLRAALVNSYGAAGSNCALLCCEMPDPAPVFETSSKTRSISLPACVGGATVKSLLANARALSTFLGQAGSELELADVAFTLNHRRKSQPYMASLEATDVRHLSTLLASLDAQSTFQPASRPQPIVLVFGGQSDSKIGLDRSFYQQIPSFRYHIDSCNKELEQLGYNSIIPAMFETHPIEDATTLQCSMFAMQYATARCWIESGVTPSAIVGHSLGELTALAVSGVLSLTDALRLVAGRARLIDTKWGAEKGAMLALSNCSQHDFESIVKLLGKAPGGEAHRLEIACYNGAETLVAVGKCACIEAAEEILRTQPGLHKIKSRRLSTSHGFHSALTDPLLEEVRELSESLQWNEPDIPLEACKPEHLDRFRGYDASKHLRQSVHFSAAVSRLESRLGPSVWLEAGVNTVAIPMARACCGQQNQHTFLSLRTQAFAQPVDAVAGIVSSLWKNGSRVTHWRLASHGPDPNHLSRDCKPVWLPPYQFERSTHWLPNIDRASEMQQQLALQPAPVPAAALASAQPMPLPQLVTMRTAAAGAGEFLINTSSKRFSQIVGGHTVCGRSICPASMYMECTTMALQQLLLHESGSTLGGRNLSFDSLSFASPLGVEPAGEVILRLERQAGKDKWKYSFCTVGNAALPTSRPVQTTHATGRVSLGGKTGFGGLERLVSGSVEQISNDDGENVEMIRWTRIYGLFARVVDYAACFRAVRSLKFRGHEGLGTVVLPEEQPGVEETTARAACDAIALDAAVQVVGLIMNSSESVANDEVMVMVGLDNATLSPKCAWDSPDGEWEVYARFGFNQDNQPVGDVFVRAGADGELVALLSGCRFSKLPTAKLEKSLDQAIKRSPGSQSHTTIAQTGPESQDTSSVASAESSVSGLGSGSGSGSSGGAVFTPATSTTGSSAQYETTAAELRTLIMECTGVDAADMSDDAAMADLGLDSLASVELVGELSSRFGITIDSADLLDVSLSDMMRSAGLGGTATKAEQGALLPSTSGLGQPPDDLPGPASGDPGSSGYQKFLQVLVDVLGVKAEEVIPNVLLADLGVDSMSANDLKQEIEEAFSVSLGQVSVDDTVQGLMGQVGIASPQPEKPRGPGSTGQSTISQATHQGSQPSSGTVLLGNPFDALRAADTQFDNSARSQNFLGHWSTVAPYEDEILLAYIVEGFAHLGVDIGGTPPGQELPQVPHLTNKYDKLVPRLWAILEKHGFVSVGPDGKITRGERIPDTRPSAQLLAAFRERFPGYEHESNLMGLTGPRLAECLTGKLDAVGLMFGNPTSMKIMENFYGRAPMMSTLTDQLVIFVTNLLRHANKASPVRILEVGAGTGGTTKRLAAALASAGIPVVYTFTDIASSLVSKAKMTLKQYPWFEYATFNLEKEVPESFKNRFDVVISTNCVHATTDRTTSCRRLRETLVPGGIVVLSEVTRVIDWYDVCFGYLDGWWLAEGRTIYPIQPASHWMSVFKAAGFASASYSGGPTMEATSQQLLVACNAPWETLPPPDAVEVPGGGVGRAKTVTFKQVSDLQIQADIFFPTRPSNEPMPVALMIHGGGHMTLSRRAIRPAQTAHLLAHGFLPVSIDYRLCPETTLAEGPMLDVCDAYRWCIETLPRLARGHNFNVDASRIVAIGWSTGGHLAMSLAWTTVEAGLQPPAAVLSFYAPVDFQSGELDAARMKSLPGRKISMQRILEALPTHPITTYDHSAKGDSTGLGWVKPGDPRSELVLSLFKEGTGLPLMIHGLPPKGSSEADIKSWLSRPVPAEAVAAISPMARLKSGQYSSPTYIVHSEQDEVAPFVDAERFVQELRVRGIPHGFLSLKHVRHIHDLALRPGMPPWEEQVAPGYQFIFDHVL